ncbi:unnamed protein product [Adineta steineri]|uniref:Uncharacterized protein n=1 Tax=Adineta steineri TaxID=433720 RepID=A0A815DEE7_9BILA|nr:unnamed protein product [Adineta steineri]CAF1297220.1 unnamed protein product [Adineta steineri]
MRTYLAIICFVLFICTVTGRSIASFSDEDGSNDIDQASNRRYINDALRFDRLQKFLGEDNSNDDDDDDNKIDAQFSQTEQESDGETNENVEDDNSADDDREKRHMFNDEDTDNSDVSSNSDNDDENKPNVKILNSESESNDIYDRLNEDAE